MVEPDEGESSRQEAIPTNGVGSRSWIIYVLGGSYPENHPLLNTPSLFTDSPTYEDMLLLSSLLGPAKPPVASEQEVEAARGLFDIKSIVDGRVTGAPAEGGEEVFLTVEERCLVCLTEYETGEVARRLGGCGHLFHRECIDTVSSSFDTVTRANMNSGLLPVVILAHCAEEKAFKRKPGATLHLPIPQHPHRHQ
jgi:RING-like zinc finger